MTQMPLNHDLCNEHTAACELCVLLQNLGLHGYRNRAIDLKQRMSIGLCSMVICP